MHQQGVQTPGCALEVRWEGYVQGPPVCVPTSKGFMKEFNVQRFLN